MTIQINPTKKSLSLFGKMYQFSEDEVAKQFSSDFPILSWHANSFNEDRKKGLLLVNDETQLSVMIFDVNAKMRKNLEHYISAGIEIALINADVDIKEIDIYLKLMSDIRIYKAHSNSMITRVNGLLEASYSVCERYPLDTGQHLQSETSQGLSDMPVMGHDRSGMTPNERTIAFFNSEEWVRVKDVFANIIKKNKTAPSQEAIPYRKLPKNDLSVFREFVGRFIPPSNLPFGQAVEYFFDTHQSEAMKAAHNFIEYVNPADEWIDNGQFEEHLQALSIEWLLFDYKARDGKTPLSSYLSLKSKQLSPDIKEAFEAAKTTQYTSFFKVLEVDKQNSLIRLEDLLKGNFYILKDISLAKRLTHHVGLFVARIFEHNGVWYAAGNPVFSSHISITESYKKSLVESFRASKTPNSFIEFAKQYYGSSDDDDLSLGLDKPTNNTIRPDDGRTSIEVLAGLKSEFEEIKLRYGVVLNWSDVVSAIKNHPRYDSPLDIVRQLLPDDISEDGFATLVPVILNAYNFIPNNEDGLSPRDRMNNL